jgi:hypothetical protein
MANYLHIDTFIFPPNLAEVTSPMRLLLKKGTEFIWDEPYIEVFNNMKLIDCTVLSYINQKFQ